MVGGEIKKVKILNADILSLKLNQLLESFDDGVLITPNVDHIMKLQKDKEFYNIYKKAEWVVCDSKIIQLGASFLGNPFDEVIPGSSFLPAFYQHHKNNKNVKIFLLGAGPGVAEKAMHNINKKVGWEMVVGCYSPSYGFEKKTEECEHIVETILRSSANTLVVGVGAPKQEKWIMTYRHLLPNIKRFMALGATLDFEAGKIRRAPIIFQKLYIEWLYRLLKEPKRLFKRYFIDDMPFFVHILHQKLGWYKNPFEEAYANRKDLISAEQQLLPAK